MVALIDLIKELAPFRWDICLHVTSWEAYSGPAALTWAKQQLDSSNAAGVPTDSGIYLLILRSPVSSYESAYLMYVGQASNLNVRFKQYLKAELTKRPKIVRLLNLYPSHIWFMCCKVAASDLDTVEDSLINAFLPPCNSEIEGVFGSARRAF